MALNYFVSGKLKITDEQFARAPKYTTKSFLLFPLNGGVGKVKISRVEQRNRTPTLALHAQVRCAGARARAGETIGWWAIAAGRTTMAMPSSPKEASP